MFNNKYPYTDFHEMNLDWVIKNMKEVNENVTSIEEKEQTLEEKVDALDPELIAEYKDKFVELSADVERLEESLPAVMNPIRVDVTDQTWQGFAREICEVIRSYLPGIYILYGKWLYDGSGTLGDYRVTLSIAKSNNPESVYKYATGSIYYFSPEVTQAVRDIYIEYNDTTSHVSGSEEREIYYYLT